MSLSADGLALAVAVVLASGSLPSCKLSEEPGPAYSYPGLLREPFSLPVLHRYMILSV